MITTNSLWEVANRGSKSTRLQTQLNYNEIFPNPPQPPNFVQIFLIRISRPSVPRIAWSCQLSRSYDALRKAILTGLTLLWNYTFSKTLTDVDWKHRVSIGAGHSAPTRFGISRTTRVLRYSTVLTR